MKTVVLFNGPPRSGKDTYAKELSKLIKNSIHVHFAEILKNATHHAFGLFSIPYDYFEERKDINCEELEGAKPRDCYIRMSECVFKPLCGENYFVKKMYTDIIQKTDADVILISDCGFNIEAKYLSECNDIKCFYCILEREGHTFKNDSREYINIDNINKSRDTYHLYKNVEDDIEKTTQLIYNDVMRFINDNI